TSVERATPYDVKAGLCVDLTRFGKGNFALDHLHGFAGERASAVLQHVTQLVKAGRPRGRQPAFAVVTDTDMALHLAFVRPGRNDSDEITAVDRAPPCDIKHGPGGDLTGADERNLGDRQSDV